MMTLKQKLKSLALISLGGTVAFAGISIYNGNEKFYKRILMPAVHLLDPETSHKLAIFLSKHRLFPKASFKDPEPLKVELFGKEFSNPIGIAAGFDKHGEAVKGLRDLGFGFVEIGSVTPAPQAGNAKPRVFRLKEDLAVINRYGFNSEGHNKVYERLKNVKTDGTFDGILGINLGKNKTSVDAVSDYVNGIKTFGNVADYLVINISSPNTPGLRNMQNKRVLKELLKSVIEARNSLEGNKPPILLKLAPDLSFEERKDIADVVKLRECKVDGLIISNTTVDRPDYLQNGYKTETGGLSGEPIKDVSTKMIAEMYRLTNGMTIIGVGGVSSGKDAYEKIKAGASAVQLYTSLVYEGPPIVTKIKRELITLLNDDQMTSISQAVGTNAKKIC